MSETLFNQFADEGALIGQREFVLNEILGPIKKQILGLNLKLSDIDSSQSKKSVDELSRATDALEKGLKASEQQLIQISEALKIFTQNASGAAKVQKDSVSATKEQGKAASDAVDGFTKLKQAYAEAAQKAKNYQLELGETHPTTIQAIKDAQELDEIIKRLNASTRSSKAPGSGDSAGNLKTEQKAADEAAAEYQRLTEVYAAVSRQVEEFKLKLGETHPVTLQAVKDAEELKATMAQLNAATVSAKAPGSGSNGSSLKDEQKAAADAAAEYKRLSEAYTVAAIQAEQYKLELGENHPTTLQAIKDAQELDVAIKNLKTNTGGNVTGSSEAAANLKAEQEAADAVATTYLQLKKAYDEATLAAYNYQLELGEAHPTTQAAIQDAAALGDMLAKLKANIKNQTAGELSKAQLADARAAEDAANSFLQLKKAYTDAALAANNYALELGETHPKTIQAREDAQALDAVLKRLAANTKAPKVATPVDNTAALKAEAKAAEDAANDYLQLAKAYDEAALYAKNLQLRLGEQHPIAVQATKDANDMANILKRLDASVGQNQRNVGNYAGALKGLGFSFTQVARELPSLAVNFQQFALAISNNLPYVADALVQTRKELAALRAEGKQAPSLFSAITKSILTWQVGLAVGITLFTVFAKQIGKFFEELFDGSTKFSRMQKELAKAMDEVNVNAKAQSAELLTLYKITQDGTQQLDDQLDATKRILEIKDEVNEATGESIKLMTDEKGVLKANAGEWDKLLFVLIRVEKTKGLLAAIGDAQKKVFESEAKDLKTFTTDVGDFFREYGDKQKGQALNKTLQIIRRQQGTADAQAYLNGLYERLEKGLKTGEFDLSGVFDTAGAEKDVERLYVLLTRGIEAARDAQLKIAADEDRFIADRIAAREAALDLDKTLLRLKAGFEIAEARRSAQAQIVEQKGNAKNIATIEANLATTIKSIRHHLRYDLKELDIKATDDELKLKEEFYERLVAMVQAKEKILAQAKKGIITDRRQEAKQEFDEEMLFIERAYSNELGFLQGSLKSGLLARETYAKKEQKLREDYENGDITAAEFEEGNKILREGLKTGFLARQEFAEREKALQQSKNKDQIDAEIKHVQAMIDTERLQSNDPKKIAEYEKRIVELKAKYRDIDFGNYKDLLQRIEDSTATSIAKQKDMWQSLQDDILEAFVSIGSGVYDRQINAIQEQIQAVDELKAAEIERINASTDTEEKKAARVILIEARAQAQREALERKQREIKKRQAIFEKAAKSFEITAEGIRTVAALQADIVKAKGLLALATASMNPVAIAAATAGVAIATSLVPLSIASTAVQLATIASTPIPKFYKGTDDSPEGVAEVAERGPELAIDKKGKVKVYEKHTLTYLTKGTKIYPADATKAILNAAEQERTTLLKAFNNNVTVSTPDHNSAELKKQTKILERLESKSRIAIINNTPIETEAWYQQHFKL